MSLQDYSGLVWRPKFTYTDCDVPVSFTLKVPQGKWMYQSRGEGGHDTATSGVQESFQVRHDRLYTLRLRITEEEWVDSVEPMLNVLWGQAQAFTVQLDASSTSTSHSVYLERPWMQDGADPTWNAYDGVLDFEMDVRSATGAAFSYPYFPSLST